jgi:hypothetical protein
VFTTDYRLGLQTFFGLEASDSNKC